MFKIIRLEELTQLFVILVVVVLSALLDVMPFYVTLKVTVKLVIKKKKKRNV